jgi:hypothetical protein
MSSLLFKTYKYDIEKEETGEKTDKGNKKNGTNLSCPLKVFQQLVFFHTIVMCNLSPSKVAKIWSVLATLIGWLLYYMCKQGAED